MTDRKPPAHLRARGRRFWRSVAADFDLEVDGYEVLAETCRVLDRIDSLEAQTRADGLVVAGSKGQKVLHPAIAEARQQRVLLDRLVRTLGIDPPGPEPGPMNHQAKKAASARWLREQSIETRRKGVGHGKGHKTK